MYNVLNFKRHKLFRTFFLKIIPAKKYDIQAINYHLFTFVIKKLSNIHAI